MGLENLIEKGESDMLEFKETFRYNAKTNNKDKTLKYEVSKAVCGMLNSKGGIVLIGVADDKKIEGIERDLNLYGKGNKFTQLDKLRIDLDDHITKTIDIKSKKFLKIDIIDVDEKKIIKIEVESSIEPFYHSEDEIFYVRDGPRSIRLSGKKMGEYISDRLKYPSVKSSEDLSQETVERIFSEFREWAQEKLKQNFSLEVNRNNRFGRIYDNLLGCVVPHTVSDNLIDFTSDLIKNYIDDYSIIKYSQTFKTPDYACQYENTFGEKILIFPNGTVKFCQIYNTFNKEQPDFALGTLEKDNFGVLDVKRVKEKYSAPFSYIKWSTLQSLLEVICFLYHPECKIQIVTSPTVLFNLEIIVPNMIYEGKNRFIPSFGGLRSNKIYLGREKDITFRKTFRYDEIIEFIKSLKKHIIDYYKNPANKGYGGLF